MQEYAPLAAGVTHTPRAAELPPRPRIATRAPDGANVASVDVAIPHPAEQRRHGHVLAGYLIFCAARGGLEIAVAWAVMTAGAVAPIPAKVLAAIGVLNVVGAAAVWLWSWTGAVMLAAAAAGSLVAASSRGLGFSVFVAALMLAACFVLAAAVPWRLRCLRCRASVSRSDAKCRQCGQPFV
jgi:hypothetical protein